VILAVLVGVAAGLGVDARSGTDQVGQHRPNAAFPFGIRTSTASVWQLLGLLTGLDVDRSMRAGAVLVLAATGLSAGFTTLSTVTDEQLAVAETGAPGQPAGSTALSVAAPLAAAAGLRWLR